MTERLDMDSLVELCDQFSSVYPLSPTGARGWVRAKREQPMTDPEVYIEWDKAHWRYHGERDGWTFEHHFRPLEGHVAEPPDIIGAPSMLDVLTEAQRKLEDERCPDCGFFHGPSDETFLDSLMQAQEVAADSEGYLIITVGPKTVNGLKVYEPRIAFETLNDTARAAIEAQLTYVAAELFELHALSRINRTEGKGEPGR